MSDDFGYNLCIGGGTNVGYKHPNIIKQTKEQIAARAKKCSETKRANPTDRNLLSIKSSRFPVIMTNIETGEVLTFINASKCEDFLGYKRGRVYDHVMRESKLLDKKYVVRRTQSIFNQFLNNQ
jgi:hypothetical protein